MKILVTGAKGFVGKNLCAELRNIKDGKSRCWGDVVIDRQLALSAIGYEPRYTLEDGIREMVESFKQQK